MALDTGQTNDIDIFEIIETILAQKVVVFLTTLVVVLLAAAYVYLVPAKQRATITIFPPTYAEASKYAQLNELLPMQMRTKLLDQGDSQRPMPFVNVDKMEEVFGTTLASFSAIRQALLICSSVAFGRANAMFSRIEPSNRNVSWSTTPSCER